MQFDQTFTKTCEQTRTCENILHLKSMSMHILLKQ